ncbi:Hypothetical predicted protein [Xyrichtys novacula]|uniref:Uncharacterized protein n=1 Tax=Xyrichtys novacula TaxID=13765 RepID=A0AAV1H038_XYRNO|nr:Hypothetical predicted protein [Xyrichtys novacula]
MRPKNQLGWKSVGLKVILSAVTSEKHGDSATNRCCLRLERYMVRKAVTSHVKWKQGLCVYVESDISKRTTFDIGPEESRSLSSTSSDVEESQTSLTTFGIRPEESRSLSFISSDVEEKFDCSHMDEEERELMNCDDLLEDEDFFHSSSPADETESNTKFPKISRKSRSKISVDHIEPELEGPENNQSAEPKSKKSKRLRKFLSNTFSKIEKKLRTEEKEEKKEEKEEKEKASADSDVGSPPFWVRLVCGRQVRRLHPEL